jgi:hypothetical protein
MKPHGSDDALSNTSLGVRRDGFQPHSASEREKNDRPLAEVAIAAATVLVDLGMWPHRLLLAAA